MAAPLVARRVLRVPCRRQAGRDVPPAAPRLAADHARPAVARGVAEARWPVWSAVGLGLVLGAAQLVRSVGLWIYAVAAVAFVVAVAVASPGLRRRTAALGATTLAIGLLVALPWYVYLQVEYGDPIFGGRPEITQGAPAPASAVPVRTLASSTEAPPPVRAPLSFFTGTGLPESITHPYRGEDVAFVPILLADTWGDFFGFWSWGSRRCPRPARSWPAQVQMVAGIPLTFVTASGLLALLALIVRSPRQRLPQLPVVALPLVGLASLVSTRGATVDGRRHGKGVVPAPGRAVVRRRVLVRCRRRPVEVGQGREPRARGRARGPARHMRAVRRRMSAGRNGVRQRRLLAAGAPAHNAILGLRRR